MCSMKRFLCLLEDEIVYFFLTHAQMGHSKKLWLKYFW